MKRLISSRLPSRSANLDGPLLHWRVFQSCRKISKRAWGEPGEKDAYFCYFQTSGAIRKSTGSRAQGGTSVATRRVLGLSRVSDHRTESVAPPEGGQPRQASCDRAGPSPSPRAGDEPA